jgi:hypothetical protein
MKFVNVLINADSYHRSKISKSDLFQNSKHVELTILFSSCMYWRNLIQQNWILTGILVISLLQINCQGERERESSSKHAT